MEAEHTVLAVNRNEELRLYEGVEHHELVPVSVARYVDVSQRLVDNVRALLVELVDDAVYGLLVARDRVSGDDDRIAFLDIDRTVRIECHTRESAHGLGLRACSKDNDPVVRIIVDRVDVDERVGLDIDVAQRVCDIEYLDHRAA